MQAEDHIAIVRISRKYSLFSIVKQEKRQALLVYQTEMITGIAQYR